MECKLLHCEYRAYKGVNYQTMPLQCIVFSGSTCSQSAIEVILVSNEADLRADSNDSSPMCISCKITKLFKLFLHRSEREHTIISEPSQYNQCPFGDVGPRCKPRTQELDGHVQYRGPLEWPC